MSTSMILTASPKAIAKTTEHLSLTDGDIALKRHGSHFAAIAALLRRALAAEMACREVKSMVAAAAPSATVGHARKRFIAS